MSLVDKYREGKNRRRAAKEARLLLREARRGLRKYQHRLTAKAAEAVRAAADELQAALDANDDERIKPALNALDQALDDHLSFARKSTFREYAESIGVAVLIALFLRAFVVEAFKIPSGSMIPTLEVGDHIFVNKFIYGVRIPWTNIKFGENYRKPRRGEVIVFIYPKEPDKDFIKRIVAVEGDTVEIQNGTIVINGKPVERHMADGPCSYWDFKEDLGEWQHVACDKWMETLDGHTFATYYNRGQVEGSWGPRTVPPGNVFVMGDNRDNSHDSRYWGFVPFDLIKGKAMIIWWSAGEPADGPGTFHSVRYGRMFHLVQ